MWDASTPDVGEKPPVHVTTLTVGAIVFFFGVRYFLGKKEKSSFSFLVHKTINRFFFSVDDYDGLSWLPLSLWVYRVIYRSERNRKTLIVGTQGNS